MGYRERGDDDAREVLAQVLPNPHEVTVPTDHLKEGRREESEGRK
jgi:hypothetical protein